MGRWSSALSTPACQRLLAYHASSSTRAERESQMLSWGRSSPITHTAIATTTRRMTGVHWYRTGQSRCDSMYTAHSDHEGDERTGVQLVAIGPLRNFEPRRLPVGRGEVTGVDGQYDERHGFAQDHAGAVNEGVPADSAHPKRRRVVATVSRSARGCDAGITRSVCAGPWDGPTVGKRLATPPLPKRSRTRCCRAGATTRSRSVFGGLEEVYRQWSPGWKGGHALHVAPAQRLG